MMLKETLLRLYRDATRPATTLISSSPTRHRSSYCCASCTPLGELSGIIAHGAARYGQEAKPSVTLPLVVPLNVQALWLRQRTVHRIPAKTQTTNPTLPASFSHLSRPMKGSAGKVTITAIANAPRRPARNANGHTTSAPAVSRSAAPQTRILSQRRPTATRPIRESTAYPMARAIFSKMLKRGGLTFCNPMHGNVAGLRHRLPARCRTQGRGGARVLPDTPPASPLQLLRQLVELVRFRTPCHSDRLSMAASPTK